MNPNSVLEVHRLGKAYRRYRNEAMRVLSWFRPLPPREETWVLRDINFIVGKGEAVGIVGQNGAGKSTLLKIITGTQYPSVGGVYVQGRIAAILELGMGFNGELTGRDNAFHAAGLMGFSRQQIHDVMPEIEAFAEIGHYFDKPMRVYSSGMQMRVAFSVATAFRPDVLIVDEALSVGDAYFQHKSFDRIRQFQQEGTSLLIVSHDKAAIQSLCNRAILLEQGRVEKDGLPQDVMDYYNALVAQKENDRVEITPLDSGLVQTHSGTGEANISSISLHDAQGKPMEMTEVGAYVELRIRVTTHAELDELVMGVKFKDRLGQDIFGTNTWHTQQTQRHLGPDQALEYRLMFTVNLGPGTYSVACSLHSSDTHLMRNYQWLDHALIFQVVNTDKNFFLGSSWLEPSIHCRHDSA